MQNQSSNQTNTPIEESQYSLLDLIGIIYRWRKQIIAVTSIAAIGTVIISLLLSNYYTASATFIPANEEKELFAEAGTKNNSLYGDDDAIDRAMIFAASSALVDFMIDSFDLANYYDIDVSTPKGEYKVVRRFRKLYDIKKNEHSGVEISIEDEDPVLAAAMVRAALGKIGSLYKDATVGNKGLIMSTYEQTLMDKRSELDEITDSLRALRNRYNIYDISQQGELLASLVVQTESSLAEAEAKLSSFRQNGGKRDSIVKYQAQIDGLSYKMNMLKSDNDSIQSSFNLNAFNEGRERIFYYENLMESLNEDISEIKTQYTQFKSQATNQADPIIILEEVQIPKIKSYPVRSLIVIGATFLAFILACVGAVLLEVYRKIDWQKVLNGDDK